MLEGVGQTVATARRLFVEVHPDRLACDNDVDSLTAIIRGMGLDLANQGRRGRQLHMLWERAA